MAAKDVAVKKYVVRSSDAALELLARLFRNGKSPAQRLLKPRILSKAPATGPEISA